MCGIAGFLNNNASAERRADVVGRMCEAMRHRGPDDGGIASCGPMTLGMRRLAIFDPANGHQPMATADGRYTLVFNGAIYNFRALRAELAAGGQSFHTQCDTEVLLAAYVRWGPECLPRLQGMFAFAVWDASEQVLFIARDPFGIKPLYFRRGPDGSLLLASELNALRACGEFEAEIDPAAVADYLDWFAVPAPRTIYRGVQSLRPGESGTWRDGMLIVRSHWDFASFKRVAAVCGTRAEFVAELRRRLEMSVSSHIAADVPVGAFLSGGLDSAVVAGLMTRLGGARLKTFSIGFSEADFSEADEAAKTAAHIGSDHRGSVLTGARVASDLEGILDHLDQPTGDGINTYYASQAARAGGVTVALSGLGGDELFGGYPSFRDGPRLAGWIRWWRLLPRSLRRTLTARLRRGDTRDRKLADFLDGARNISEIASMQRRVFDVETRGSLLSRDASAAVLGTRNAHHPEASALAEELNGAGAFETISAWELRTYMADVLLRDSDVMSMRHSLELRVPFIDRPFIEWLWCQPSQFKEDRDQPKSALAEAVNDLLPPGMAQRRKQGFSLPFPIWMKRELKPFLEETFSSSSVARSGLLETAPVQSLWRGYLAGDDNREWSRVWSLAVMIAFANRRAPVPGTSAPRQVPAAPEETANTLPVQRRILLVAPEIFASEGGITRILQIYLKALCESAGPSERVRLVALNDPVVDSMDLRRSANQRLEQWHVCSRSKSGFVRSVLRMSRGCSHLVCGHVAQLPVAWMARVLNPRLRYFLVAHGIEVWRPFTFAERLALRGARRILCVSDYTRRELLKNCPLPADRAVVLPNALDPAFEIGPGMPLDKCDPAILVVTRLTAADRYKGVEHMIQAMPAIRAAIPAATLRIVGRGDDVGYLTAMSKKLELNGSVSFLGFLKDSAMAAEMKSCRLFALPSKKEGFGLVFLEAMANGRPCVGADAGGIPEVITADSGLLVPFGDVPALASACIGALRRSWDEHAILRRATYFSYSRFRERLASLLDS